MRDTLILALDGIEESRAFALTRLLWEGAYCVKVHDLLDGTDQPTIIGRLKDNGATKVWVDYKLHDIPKTVGRRAKKLKQAGADIITVHASGGKKMIEAAVESGAEIFAISALTSLTPQEIREIYGQSPAEAVQYLAGLATVAGAAGIVCSALEVPSLRHLEPRFKRVVPGTRSIGVTVGDQKRVDTPVAALQGGAHHLVIASQVTEDPDPVAAWQRIVDEIASVS